MCVYNKQNQRATHVKTVGKTETRGASSWHGTIERTHQSCPLGEGRGRNQRESNKREGVSSNGNKITSTCRGCLCFYLSHHLYLELYEFSTIHATKMSKDSLFFFLLYLAAPGVNDVARLRSGISLSLHLPLPYDSRKEECDVFDTLSPSPRCESETTFTLRQVARKRSTVSRSSRLRKPTDDASSGW